MAENSKQTAGTQRLSERDAVEGRNASGIGNEGGSSGASGKAASQEVKQQARELADQTRHQGKAMLEQQRSSAAGQVDSMAHAFRSTADQLQREGQSSGNYVGMLADGLESAARQLREKNLDEILHDVQGLARRSPATFIAGSVAAGFLLSRFLKSSGRHAQDRGSYEQDTGYEGARHSSSASEESARWDGDTYTGAGGPYASSSGERGSVDDFGDLSYRTGRDSLGDGSSFKDKDYYSSATGLAAQPVAGGADTDASSSSAIKPESSHLGGNEHGNR